MTGLSHTSGRITSATLSDGTVVSVNDYVYMASEFTGESYYIGRLMEFAKEVKGKPLQCRIGWFYRPKDVMARKHHDPRLLVATMHSDMNPLSSIRGRCTVTHQAYIKDLDAYRRLPDHFYYSQLFDRYIHRFYDVLPVESVRNLPPDVAEELARRYQFIVVEAGTASEYTDAHRVCLICKRWCASGEALKCIRCLGFHHMLCINPPMLRKPSKGFAFQCALCTKLAMDSASSSPSTPSSLKPSAIHHSPASSGQNSPRGSPKQKSTSTIAIAPSNSNGTNSHSSTRSHSRTDSTALQFPPSLPMEQKMSHMWPFRYFGTHADIRDIFDPDDRVYPRASSRVGTKYQAMVVKWDGPGKTLMTSTLFDDPLNNGKGRKKNKGGRPPNRLRFPEADQTEASSRAPSMSLESGLDGVDTPLAPSSPARSTTGQEEPLYVERGGDDTVKLLYSKPDHVSEDYVAKYMDRVKALSLPLPAHSADLIDKALLQLQSSGFDADKALKELTKLQKRDFDIKNWTPKEVEAFEEGIRLYGHELFAIKKNVETRSMKDVVRFFYQWKKTERYQPVYSVFTNINKPNKKFKSVGRGVVTSPVVEVGHRARVGQDAEQTAVLDYDSIIMPTLDNASKLECAHCGTTSTTMWRRAPGEVDKQKKYPRVYCEKCGSDWVRYITLPPQVEAPKEPKKRGPKEGSGKNQVANGSGKTSTVATDAPVGTKRKRGEPKTATSKKLKEQSREPTRSPSPEPEVPCAVCNMFATQGGQLMKCQGCRLAVHRGCYGVSRTVPLRKWNCDTCLNNQNPTCSTTYNCVLCTSTSDHEPQALKRTTGHNWAHVLCAVWVPEITFADVDSLSPVESIGRIRTERWKQTCHICKQKTGACVSCGEGCKKAFHVTCARQAGYQIAFEMQPVKNVKGGVMVPMIWCGHHDLSSRHVIQIQDQPDALTDSNALQTYVHYHKQSDVSVPGAMRKCRLLMALNPGLGAGGTWLNHAGSVYGSAGGARRSSQGGIGSRGTKGLNRFKSEESCSRCEADVSPIWWAANYKPEPLKEEGGTAVKTEGEDRVGLLASEGNKAERKVVCHACFWDMRSHMAAERRMI